MADKEDLRDSMQVVIAKVADRLGVDTGDAKPMRQHSNTVVAFPKARLVVRVAGNPDSFDNVAASVKVTRWLGRRGYPCVVPADIDQPFVVSGHVVSVWRLVDVTSNVQATGAILGHLLRTLHGQPAPPFPLREFADPLTSVARAAERTPGAMAASDRTWLLAWIDDLRERWRSLDFSRPYGLIHGDAHPGNVMGLRDGKLILGDWDHVAIGPREWDLVQIHYMLRRFQRVTPHDIEDFVTAYGSDLRGWGGLRTLIEIRETTGLSAYIRTAARSAWHRQEVAYRLKTIREQDDGARWNPPSD